MGAAFLIHTALFGVVGSVSAEEDVGVQINHTG